MLKILSKKNQKNKLSFYFNCLTIWLTEQRILNLKLLKKKNKQNYSLFITTYVYHLILNLEGWKKEESKSINFYSLVTYYAIINVNIISQVVNCLRKYFKNFFYGIVCRLYWIFQIHKVLFQKDDQNSNRNFQCI